MPILEWLPNYKIEYLPKDILAGVTVGTMLIPQGMAYALLAGLPPIAGLYAALVPLILYPVFGTSRQLSVGPVAMDSLLVASGVGTMVQSGSDQYWVYAVLLALMVGVIQMLMGVLRLGFLVNFLSQPLINGFTSAAAIIIGLSQVKHLFGIDFQGSQQVLVVLTRMIGKISDLHVETLILGLGCISLLVFLVKWKPGLPGALITVVLSILAVYIFDLDKMGVQIVGEVPEGLPALTIPAVDGTIIVNMLPIAFTIALISFMEGIAIAKKFAVQDGYPVSANQELIAIGVSNFSAGLFGGYPIAGSFSRTAVNKHAGAITPVSSIFNALTIGLTLMFLTPLFYYMPKAVLASIVVVAVSKLIDFKEPKRLFHLRKVDFLVLLFSFLITLLLGAQRGILLGAAVSIILIVRRISYPNVAILGRVGNSNIFKNIKIIEEAHEVSNFLFFRIDASLYYANAGYLKDNVFQAINNKPTVKVFVFDLSSVNEIDATAIAALFEVADELKKREIAFYMTNVKASPREMIRKSGFYEHLGKDRFLEKNEQVIALFDQEVQTSKDIHPEHTVS